MKHTTKGEKKLDALKLLLAMDIAVLSSLWCIAWFKRIETYKLSTLSFCILFFFEILDQKAHKIVAKNPTFAVLKVRCLVAYNIELARRGHSDDGLGTNFNWVIAVHIAITRATLPATRKHSPCGIWELHNQWESHTRPHSYFLYHLHHPHIGS